MMSQLCDDGIATMHQTHQARFSIKTGGHRHMHDVTPHVEEIVGASRIRTGIAHVFNVGSTGAIGTIEFEPGLEQDLPDTLDRLMPPSPDYGHEQAWHDGNGHSHLQATVMGPGLAIPIAEGRPVLGTWQQIFHLECDNKPRTREIVVTVIGSECTSRWSACSTLALGELCCKPNLIPRSVGIHLIGRRDHRRQLDVKVMQVIQSSLDRPWWLCVWSMGRVFSPFQPDAPGDLTGLPGALAHAH
jgi:secondary thiamine-phosphate synthase enzyme